MRRLGRPDWRVQNTKYSPQAGNSALSLIDDLCELSYGFKKSICQKNEANQRACAQTSSWSDQQACTHNCHHGEYCKNLSRWKQKRADYSCSNVAVSSIANIFGDRSDHQICCLISVQCLCARHHLTENTQKLCISLPRNIVRVHQSRLHETKYENQWSRNHKGH